MAYEKQEWVPRETVVSAARMGHIEDGLGDAHSLIEGLQAKTAVSYALNNSPSIPHNTATVPTGWLVFGQQVPAVTYVSASGSFRINTPGNYLVALSGSYANGPTSGNMEYRVDLNGTRILAAFGTAGDVSSRSGVTVVRAVEGDLITPNYSQTSGAAVALRPNSFNTITFAQIG